MESILSKTIRRERHILRKELFGGLVIDRTSGLLCAVNRTGYEIAYLLLKSSSVTPEEISLSLAKKYGSDKLQIISDDVDRVAKMLFEREFQPTHDALECGSLPNGMDGHLSSPVDVFWEITWRCNLKCIHCYSESGSRGVSITELGTEEALSLVKELSNLGVNKVVIGGGEPLMRSDLFEIIGAGIRAGIDFVLVSNGTLFSEKRCREFLDSGLKEVAISIDGSIPEIHDAFRNCNGAFKNAVEGCKRLVSKGVKVHVQTLVSKQNVMDIRRIIELCVYMGVASWDAKFLIPAGRGKELYNLSLDPSEFEAFRTLVESLRDEFHHKISIGKVQRDYSLVYSFEETKPSDGSLSCGPGVTTCGITPDGRLLACSYLQDEAWASERVAPGKFSEIWRESKIFDPFRNLMRSSLRECFRCKHLDLCRGGCRARAYLSCGDFFAKDCKASWIKD